VKEFYEQLDFMKALTAIIHVTKDYSTHGHKQTGAG
jgi:hypothetical protein